MRALANQHLFIVADEAHFGCVGSVVNITIGSLESNLPSFAVIATSKKAMTGDLLSHEIMKALCLIWDTEDEVLHHQHQILSLTTDGAAYNSKAARLLKAKGLKSLHHFLCLVHGLSLVINTIVDNHPSLKEFASNVQSTFSKSVVQQVEYEQSSNDFIEESLRDHLLRLTSSTDKDKVKTTGAVSKCCNVEKTRILPHLPVSLTTTIEPCSNKLNFYLPPRPLQVSTSNAPIQIPLLEECPPSEELNLVPLQCLPEGKLECF